MDALSVTQDTAATPDVHALLIRHFELMRAASPAESCHVLEPGTLLDTGAVLFAARSEGTLLGVGALATLEPTHGELKSMHTAAAARGRGVGAALVAALMDHARTRGMTRLSLETGSDALFAPARALYSAHGFTLCAPFGDYVLDPLSVFMTRTL
ncbi:GNAT family N-acetyltransferase [uncultured Tateyamaria sp.]|uniref:GNAT family N-acetyltransferase n=1 Tax=uncultured Tateyamaria sp. TaxID=455651 RepID=UPI002618BCEA|nr:GNAT family N-acetyltransferase [uncultured Tateyamaria sp.]